MISVIIPTCGRLESLKRLLQSLNNLNQRDTVDHEVLLLNNATHPDTAASVDALLKHELHATNFVLFREERPGKSRCLNRAIEIAKGEIVAFVDDDVAVDADWLVQTQAFFEQHGYDAMQGAIHFPKEYQSDESFLRAWQRYRTIPHIDFGPKVKQIRKLTGANIALKREALDRVGLFDERLGPGEAGTSEDFDFGKRLLQQNMRIGYAPGAVVYHEIDWSRLSESYFRRSHENQGRSRRLIKSRSFPTITLNYIRALLGWGWYSILGKERAKYRHKGRCFHYRAMLTAKLADSLAGGGETGTSSRD